MGTIIVGLILLVIVIVALKCTIKQKKTHKCNGNCSGCGGSCH